MSSLQEDLERFGAAVDGLKAAIATAVCKNWLRLIAIYLVAYGLFLAYWLIIGG